VSFPDYGTSIGEEIARALANERDYGPDVMQLLYVANRYEKKSDLLRWLEGGLILVADRYAASSVAYGEALDLDPAWLTEMQRFLPPASLTILLDICAGDGGDAQVGRSRPHTSATWRCRGASAKAICARRWPSAGSCSTASGRRT